MNLIRIFFPGFVPFGAIQTHFGDKSSPPVSESESDACLQLYLHQLPCLPRLCNPGMSGVAQSGSNWPQNGTDPGLLQIMISEKFFLTRPKMGEIQCRSDCSTSNFYKSPGQVPFLGLLPPTLGPNLTSLEATQRSQRHIRRAPDWRIVGAALFSLLLCVTNPYTGDILALFSCSAC